MFNGRVKNWAKKRLAAGWMLLPIAAVIVWYGLVMQNSTYPAEIPDLDVVYAQPLNVTHSSAGGVAAMPAADSQARLVLPVAEYDFGMVDAQAVVEHVFYLVNGGTQDLMVERAYTTCGCTSAELSTAVIPPGKAGRLIVRFDAETHAGSSLTVRRGLVIETNDPTQPQAEIWIQASIGSMH